MGIGPRIQHGEAAAVKREASGAGVRDGHYSGPPMRCLALLAALPALALGAGCGGDGGAAPAPPPRSQTDAVAPLARAPARAGEVVVRGQASPASHGPFRFDGTYRVRFEQVAPEDPGLDFGSQTSFVAALHRRAEVEDRGSVRLFSKAAARGERRLRLRGRFFVDVAFGDFPYALRFTPVR